ncbi:hypothetical protein BGX33_002487 [Mortierella sp. NVP41]|nr:hypothetical protein BGX33_002487 [Mortierella sp. NVP41]
MPFSKTLVLRYLRVWMVVLTLLNFSVMIGYYVYSFQNWNIRNLLAIRPDPFDFFFKDGANIFAATALFLTYLYALLGPPKVHKYTRAILILVLAVLLVYINSEYIAKTLKLAEKASDFLDKLPFNLGKKPQDYVRTALDCEGTSPENIRTCQLNWATRVIAIITSIFVVPEIVLTILWGPLPSTKGDATQPQMSQV